MKLFIVESPNKCNKLRGYLGDDYRVTASVGHIREIPQKGINIDIKNGFTPTYQISNSKKKVVKEIKELAVKAEQIILATDPDREGEAISQSIYDVLDKKNQDKCVRVTFNEITKKAVLDAVAHPRDIDSNLVDAQKARQVLDRLIGYKVSPILWFTVGSGTSAGRVQSIALRLICDRQKEIDAFKPVDFWFVEALLKAKKGEFWAKVITKEKDNRFLNEKLSQEALEELKKATFAIDKVEKDTKTNNAYPPFDTTSLQSGCSSIFKWSATKTMTLAQKLYEEGKISYLRTDSYTISEEALKEVRELIKKAGGDSYLPEKPNVYSKKSNAAAQEAHECIRPTHVYEKGDDIDEEDKKKMYKLIRDRFIACQMTPMVVDTVTYYVKTNTKHNLIAKGQTIKFDGWFKVYKYSKTKEEILPDVEDKEELDLKEIKSTKHTTQPPPHFNDGSLIKKMEAEGVGRPSTRASIIKAIQDKGYVGKERGQGGGFTPTPLGVKIVDYLSPRFKDFFMDIKYTSQLENDLDEIANGNKPFINVVESVYKVLTEHIKDAKANAPERSEPEKMGEKCTSCKKGEIVKKNGRFGDFFTCSNYPECKVIFVKDEESGKFSIKKKPVQKKTGVKCQKCNKGNIVEKKGQYGEFYACDNYPSCKTIYIKNDKDEFEIKQRKYNN